MLEIKSPHSNIGSCAIEYSNALLFLEYWDIWIAFETAKYCNTFCNIL